MPNADKLFQKAEKLLQKQKFDSAREIYLELFKIQPRNEAVIFNLADLSLRLGKSDDSRQFHSLLVDLYTERKDFPKAIATCRKIIKADPHDAQALAKLGLLLKASGKCEEAVGAFHEAAAIHHRIGNNEKALECLRSLVDLEPENLDVQTQLAELARNLGRQALALTALLKAVEIARSRGLQDRWAELAERAHQLDPDNKAACLATAEVALSRDSATEAIRLLEPISQSEPDNSNALILLCRAYLASGEYAKAEPICLRLYQANSETLGLTEQLIRGLLSSSETEKALTIVEGIKEQMYRREEKRAEFLALVEQIYRADENNLEVLELLPPLYNELNREGDLRRSLARLFNLYLAGEQYSKAAETLESILDADPYGAGHTDRLLNLEGHIDTIWYNNIAGRISVPGTGSGLTSAPSADEAETPPASAALDDLIVEAEMFYRYHLDAKFQETLKKIDRLYPGAQEDNSPLRELYEMAGFKPTPFERPAAQEIAAPENAKSPLSVEELAKVSAITAAIHRQADPEHILSTAAEQLGRLVNASRCWIAAGPADSTALTAECVAIGVRPSDPAPAYKIYSFLTQQTSAHPEGWSLDEVVRDKRAGPIAAELHLLGISSLLAVPLADKEHQAGLLLLQQCGEPRHWTEGEKALAKTIAAQLVIAINNTRLRRLVRSLAGTDAASGLLPRSAYLDCLLAEATRAEEQSQPLSVCLIEPAGAQNIFRQAGDTEMQSYIQNVGKTLTSYVRQNDIAIRYGPYTIALCLPNTPLVQARMVVEKLRTALRQIRLHGELSPELCAVVGQLFAGPGFDAEDSVTELINRLEVFLETLHTKQEAEITITRFDHGA